MPRRRDILSLAATGILGVPLLRTRAQAQSAVTGKRPKNIIYMVSDGMSTGVLPLAELAALRLHRKPTHWAGLLRDSTIARGLFDQASLSGPVTDSAAASSSWGSGSRVANGAINTLPDGTALTPLMALAKEKGLRTGLVTTTSIWDATPAGFASSVPKRSQKETIAEQYRSRVDVLMGGGREAFDGSKRSDKKNLIEAYRESGYHIATTKGGVGKRRPGDRLLALFGEGSLPYTIDHVRDTTASATIPTLAEMTRVALAALSQAPKGFLLQVEGARIDHAAHANDAAALIHEQLAFDAAIGVALEFSRRDGETLIVLCTDHGNSNPGLNGMGSGYARSGECIERAIVAKASFSAIAKKLGNRSDYTMDASKASDSHSTAASAVMHVIRDAYGVDLTGFQASAIARAAAGEKGISLNLQQDTLVGVLGQVLSNVTGVGFVGTSHTADYVTSTAAGPGQEFFEGLLRNTGVFETLTTLMDTPYRNPSAEGRLKQVAVADIEPEAWAV